MRTAALLLVLGVLSGCGTSEQWRDIGWLEGNGVAVCEAIYQISPAGFEEARETCESLYVPEDQKHRVSYLKEK